MAHIDCDICGSKVYVKKVYKVTIQFYNHFPRLQMALCLECQIDISNFILHKHPRRYVE